MAIKNIKNIESFVCLRRKSLDGLSCVGESPVNFWATVDQAISPNSSMTVSSNTIDVRRTVTMRQVSPTIR